MSIFKIVTIAIFSVCIVAGVAIFALSKNSTSGGSANIVVWGTIPNEVFDVAYKNSSIAVSKDIMISYVKKDQDSFDSDLVEAIASGSGPDAVLLRDDFVYRNRNKLLTIPYNNYPERNFKDTFIEGGELSLTSEGITAFPFIVDPMVMYWNRNMFSNSSISQPPRYWEELYLLIDKLAKRNGADVLESAIALGEWRNITNAKEIITMLLLQAGTPIVSRTNSGGIISVLNSQFDYPVQPSLSAVNFYTEFSNPISPKYTWNRSLPLSLNMFLSGKLAMYLGFASEIFPIQQKNSNLNFDVTYVPQIKNTPKKTVFAHMYSLAIIKQSKQISGAFTVITALTESTAIKALSGIMNLPPVRRDLLGERPSEAFQTVFFNSAIISHSWIDPNLVGSSNVFRDMIESITSGRSRDIEALNRANQELSALLR
ncbi:MAG: extracellular solute-binding protein [Minisyncoccia bacterium]